MKHSIFRKITSFFELDLTPKVSAGIENSISVIEEYENLIDNNSNVNLSALQKDNLLKDVLNQKYRLWAMIDQLDQNILSPMDALKQLKEIEHKTLGKIEFFNIYFLNKI